MNNCECGYPCGLGHDEEIHARLHLEYLQGPLITVLQDLVAVETIEACSLFVIDDLVPLQQREEFFRLALVACRCTGFSAGYDGSQPMLVLANDSRAIGMVCVTTDAPCWRLSWTDDGSLRLLDDASILEPRLKVARVWIAGAFRRRGLGSHMLRATAGYFQMRCEDLAWELPLTSDGARLVRSVLPGEWLGRGDTWALHLTLKQFGGKSQLTHLA